MDARRRDKISLIATLLLLLAAGIFDIHRIDRTVFSPQSTDFVSVAWGMKATLRGENPYSAETTHAIQRIYYGHPLANDSRQNPMAYVYPAYTAVVLAPLALFSLEHVSSALLVLLPILALVTAILWLSLLGLTGDVRNERWVAKVTPLFLASWPMLWAVRLQQPTLIEAFFLALGCWLLRPSDTPSPIRDALAGLVFAAAAIKPQLAGPLLLWLAVWTIWQRRGIRRVAFSAGFSMGIAGLLLIANRLVPGWFSEWRRASTELLRTHQQPELVAALGAVGWVMMAALVVIAVMALARIRNEFAASCALVLAGTVALLPGGDAMLYNQVLLLPAVLLLLVMAQRGRLIRTVALALLSWQYAVMVIVALLQLVHPNPLYWAMLYRTMLFPSIVVVALGQQVIQSRKPAAIFANAAT